MKGIISIVKEIQLVLLEYNLKVEIETKTKFFSFPILLMSIIFKFSNSHTRCLCMRVPTRSWTYLHSALVYIKLSLVLIE
jgi:hypothetical protein